MLEMDKLDESFVDLIWFIEYCVKQGYIGLRNGRMFKTKKAHDKGFKNVIIEYHENGYPLPLGKSKPFSLCEYQNQCELKE